MTTITGSLRVDRTHTFVIIPLPVLLRMKHVSDKSCRKNQQATDDNMAHAHITLDTYDYKHTLRICNTYCLSTATMVA